MNIVNVVIDTNVVIAEQYLLKRAKQGKERAFLEAMSKVPDVEPEEKDRLI